MNIRKNIDYSTMYVKIEAAMHAELIRMERCFAIGQAVAERPEKGAAVAAAEYIQTNWPDERGYSPRNLRRMRELYRVYDGYGIILGKDNSCFREKTFDYEPLVFSRKSFCFVKSLRRNTFSIYVMNFLIVHSG